MRVVLRKYDVIILYYIILYYIILYYIILYYIILYYIILYYIILYYIILYYIILYYIILYYIILYYIILYYIILYYIILYYIILYYIILYYIILYIILLCYKPKRCPSIYWHFHTDMEWRLAINFFSLNRISKQNLCTFWDKIKIISTQGLVLREWHPAVWTAHIVFTTQLWVHGKWMLTKIKWRT